MVRGNRSEVGAVEDDSMSRLCGGMRRFTGKDCVGNGA